MNRNVLKRQLDDLEALHDTIREDIYRLRDILDLNYHTITEEDLKPTAIITIRGKKFGSSLIFGGLKQHDVGKRLHLRGEILQMENQEQFERRQRESS